MQHLLLSNRIRKGFTLIELLIVIAIIAILAALLAPAISAVRSKAKNAICMSNIRQIGMAAVEYSADHKGLFPSSQDWVVARGFNNYGIWADWSSMQSVRDGSLFPYLAKDPSVYVCPVFYDVYKIDPNIAHLEVACSYCMNEYFNWDRNTGQFRAWQGYQMSRGSIIYASRLGLFGEENTFLVPGRNNWIINNLALGVGHWFNQGSIVDACASFHNAPAGDLARGQSHVCFVDGHVEMVDPTRSKVIFTPEMVKRSRQ